MNGLERQDREFLELVKQRRSMGYGRMMQIISLEWYRDCQRRGDPTSGVLVANSCLCYIPKREQEAFARMAASDVGGDGR